MKLRGGDLFWESYKVTTEDDYILTMFRITGVSSDKSDRIEGQGSLGPLLLMHGHFADATHWLTAEPTDPDV